MSDLNKITNFVTKTVAVRALRVTLENLSEFIGWIGGPANFIGVVNGSYDLAVGNITIKAGDEASDQLSVLFKDSTGGTRYAPLDSILVEDPHFGYMSMPEEVFTARYAVSLPEDANSGSAADEPMIEHIDAEVVE